MKSKKDIKESIKKCIKCKKEKPIDNFPIRKEKNKPQKPRNECKACTKIYKDKYYAKNIETILVDKKAYREDPKNKKHRRKWDKDKRKTNVQHRLRINLRNRLNSALKKDAKAGSAVSDLGCSIDYLKKHLESKFYANPETGKMMTWKSWSRTGWHIDHIKPLSSFDLSNEKQFKEACHYTNLQPMWSKENIRKGAK